MWNRNGPIAFRILAAVALIVAPSSLRAQGPPAPTVGWYNGDWQSGIGLSWANWYTSGSQFARVYDDFVVPASGWTVAGVFSNNTLSQNAAAITQAAWEIRLGMEPGFGGGVVASGIGPA